MYKVQSMLKMLALTLVFSFFVSCSDDDDNTNNPISTNPGGTTGTIEASELIVTGKLVGMDGYHYGTFKDWSHGACKINVYFGPNVSGSKIGEGTVNSDGTFSYTLPKSMESKNVWRVDYNYDGLSISPSDLSIAMFPAQAYVEIDGNEKIMETKIVDADDSQKSVPYYYYFYSADGTVTGEATNFAGSVVATYDINCKKGWNLESRSTVPSKYTTPSTLPTEAKTYILEF